MFQMLEHSAEPWGREFRGVYGLDAIIEIMRGFERAGVRLMAFFMEDEISVKDYGLIAAAFASLGGDAARRWHPCFDVCPMMFAAAQGLDRAVAAFLAAKSFAPRPDQVLDGEISALGAALMRGRRPDIAAQLMLAKPSSRTLSEAIGFVQSQRDEYAPADGVEAREAWDSVLDVLRAELARRPGGATCS